MSNDRGVVAPGEHKRSQFESIEEEEEEEEEDTPPLPEVDQPNLVEERHLRMKSPT